MVDAAMAIAARSSTGTLTNGFGKRLLPIGWRRVRGVAAGQEVDQRMTLSQALAAARSSCA